MCHHRYNHGRRREREPFEAPAPPAGPIRVGDADRELAVEALRAHASAGRLDADELSERLDRAFAAKYAADLDAVLAELPAAPASDRERPRHAPPRIGAFPVAVAVLVAVAAITGAWWLLWLIWPLAITLGPRHGYRRARV